MTSIKQTKLMLDLGEGVTEIPKINKKGARARSKAFYLF